ncbi:hypothetical protein BD410DRAFT_294217 [Rickenella mellea]|uniref:Uncharacterized protein n=1 Tax=Rickenella mellea TaxID=50990 RepID=A0A4Y7Q1J8_9AGAM|nr:hypothetical protein BD410DRAFT_294217 [Rickenella mellea]
MLKTFYRWCRQKLGYEIPRKLRVFCQFLPWSPVLVFVDFFTSVTNFPIRTLRAASRLMATRQHQYRNELDLHDSHAIRWALQYSKERSGVFTTVSSVPDFISSHNDDFPSWCKAHAILSNPRSGIVEDILRIFQSCVSRFGEMKGQRLGGACLETFLWLTRCSTLILDSEELEDDSTTELEAHLTSRVCHILELILNRADDDTKKLCSHAIANMVLRCAYKLELCSRACTMTEYFMSQVHTRQMLLLEISRGYRSDHVEWQYLFDGGLLDYRSVHHFTTARLLGRDISGSLFGYEPRAPGILCIFRSEFAARIFHSCDPISQITSVNSLRSLCDIATHFQEFPQSSREIQVYIFKLVDAILRHATPNPQRPAANHSSSNQMEYHLTCKKYAKVVFGNSTSFLDSLTARPENLYTHFFQSVRVYGIGNDFTLSDTEIGIRFDLYSEVMKDVFTRLQSSEALEDEWQRQKPQSLIIQRFLEGRVRDVGDLLGVSFVIDAEHLVAMRALRASSSEMRGLIGITAHKLGYSYQLWEGYNIEMHAELQFYDPDILKPT